MKGRYSICILFTALTLLCTAGAGAEVALPLEDGMIQNAGSGTEIWGGGPSNGVEAIVKTAVQVSPYSCNAMVRPAWSEFEKKEGVYDFAGLERSFENALKYGQKLNLAVFLVTGARSQTIDGAYCAYPKYVHQNMRSGSNPDRKYTMPYGGYEQWEPDYQNDYFFQRYDALLAAFADYLEGSVTVEGRTTIRKKLVRLIEMRHFGWWGEGAYPKALLPDNSACLIRYVDAYRRHFPDIRLAAPTNGMVYSSIYAPLKEYHFYLLSVRNNVGVFGLFRDNYGWNEDNSYVQALYYDKNLWEKDGQRLVDLLRSRWKRAPVTGEPGRWYPDGKYVPYRQLERQAMCLRPCVIRNCNVSQGETGGTNKTGYDIRTDSEAIAGFHRFYSMIGFRYIFQNPKVDCEPDGTLRVALNWQNIGLTPTYDAWNVRFILRDAQGRELWSGVSKLDLRTLLPDENRRPGEQGAPTAVADAFQIEPRLADLTEKSLYLRIEDPDGISRPMALGVRGRADDGAYLLK